MEYRGSIHIGFGVILLFLLVIFVVISMTNPEQGDKIAHSVGQIANATQGKS